MTAHITVVGGGIAGLSAAISAAERGLAVTLHEAHHTLGGRARSTSGDYVANDGTHVFYGDGPAFRWLADRGFVRPYRRPSVTELARLRVRHGGGLRAVPPGSLLRMITHRSRRAPVDESFADWAGRRFGEEATRAACGLVGVITYDADPGRLSAAFVWERVLRAVPPGYPTVRYAVGGWGAVIARMAARAVELGVRVELGSRVDTVEPPVIVATTLDAARGLLGDASLTWDSGHAVLLDLGVRADRHDLFLVSDLDEGGFVERYSMPDPTLAPSGHSLAQAEMPLHTGESRADGLARLEGLADLALPGWRDRVTWRREALAHGRTGALDLPGRTWRDRPAVDRGGGVWLAGDSVAAPGLLGEVSVTSARRAAELAAADLRVAVP